MHWDNSFSKVFKIVSSLIIGVGSNRFYGFGYFNKMHELTAFSR